MKAIFNPCRIKGTVKAPPSKSMAHRYLIGAALSKKNCVLKGVDFSEDILASMDCLKSLGVDFAVKDDIVKIEPQRFMTLDNSVLECRESGSTLRFFIPLALCLGEKVTLKGSNRLFERPLVIYEKLCEQNGFFISRTENSVSLCGKLDSGKYSIRGDISSQFITGLIFALTYLNEESSIEIIPPFESRSYVNLTVSALKSFGADIEFLTENSIVIRPSELKPFTGTVEGDYSNAAFLDAFNYFGSAVVVENLNKDSLQGDRVYKDYFERLSLGAPTLDISDCPDLGPILIAFAAMKNGAVFTGTDRLKIKESDRGAVMHKELQKLGGGLIFSDNSIIVPKQMLQYNGEILDGHNDHRIVMALSVILSVLGGSIDSVQAVSKSYPGFFTAIKKLGAEVVLE